MKMDETTQPTETISRKEAIKRTGLILGGVVFAPSILGVLKGCTAQPGDWTPTFFSREQARTVTALADVILPEDDSPSASQVGVPAFIEEMVSTVYTEEQRQEFLNGLNQFEDAASEELQARFPDLDNDRRYEFTYNLNRIALEEEPGRPGGTPFILMFKELTMLGYFTSEAGATEVLSYVAVPGVYEGCTPVTDATRTWAT
ncbi:MAG: gluconate 2-dehydrogenase subunit 3 family protein [Balneolaceae bacterium]